MSCWALKLNLKTGSEGQKKKKDIDYIPYRERKKQFEHFSLNSLWITCWVFYYRVYHCRL